MRNSVNNIFKFLVHKLYSPASPSVVDTLTTKTLQSILQTVHLVPEKPEFL